MAITMLAKGVTLAPNIALVCILVIMTETKTFVNQKKAIFPPFGLAF